MNNLPSEIFFEIFDYLTIQEIHQSFSGFNQLLKSYTNIPAKLVSYQDKHSLSIDFFASHITRLRLNYSYSINLSLFSSLRSLQIVDLSHRLSYSSLKILDKLEHLSIVHNNQWNNRNLIELSNDVFKNSFPSLEICQLGEFQLLSDYQWTTLFYLRSLTIAIRDANIYPKILVSCPKLVRLKLIIDFLTKPTPINPSQHLLIQKFELNATLRSVSICQIIDYLLSYLPNIDNLIIHGPKHHSKSLDLHLLGSILRKNLCKLSKFYFQMSIDKNLSTKFIEKQVTTIHPLFQQIKLTSSGITIHSTTKKTSYR